MTHADLALPTPIVPVDWLQAHLDHPHLVVIDCRFALANPQAGQEAYHAGHVPGAFYLDLNQDLSSPVQRHGGRHPLPDWQQFAEKLGSLGIASEPPTRVVAYDATKGAFAARLWWMLRYLGHTEVAVLDGGWQAWQAVGGATETRLPQSVERGNFVPQTQANWLADREGVIAQQQAGNAIVDARSPERYRGEQEPIDPVAGAIPGADNVFWQSNLDGQGRFRDAEALSQLWSTRSPTADAIFYCGSGVTACVNLLAQAVMQRPMPRLYPGGWSDWCSYTEEG